MLTRLIRCCVLHSSTRQGVLICRFCRLLEGVRANRLFALVRVSTRSRAGSNEVLLAKGWDFWVDTARPSTRASNTIQESTTSQEYLLHVVSKLSIDLQTRFVGMNQLVEDFSRHFPSIYTIFRGMCMSHRFNPSLKYYTVGMVGAL